MVTIHHSWCCVSRSIWSHSADGSNCPGSYGAVTESDLMAASLMMMSSVPLHWDPVQFQKQIHPFIFQIIVTLYQLLPVFYQSFRLMWSFSQTALCANGTLERTRRVACVRVCVLLSVRWHFYTSLLELICVFVGQHEHMHLSATEQACISVYVSICLVLHMLLITTMHLLFYYYSPLFALLCVYLWDRSTMILSVW